MPSTTRNRLGRAAVALPLGAAPMLGTAACAGDEGVGVLEEEAGI